MKISASLVVESQCKTLLWYDFFFFFLREMLLNKENVLLNTEDERNTFFLHGFVILPLDIALSLEYQYWNRYS